MRDTYRIMPDTDDWRLTGGGWTGSGCPCRFRSFIWLSLWLWTVWNWDKSARMPGRPGLLAPQPLG